MYVFTDKTKNSLKNDWTSNNLLLSVSVIVSYFDIYLSFVLNILLFLK